MITNKISLMSIIAIAALVAFPVQAEDKKATDTKKTEVAEDPNKKICQKYRPTGTRIMKKTCMTQRGWDELKRRAQDAARTSQRLSGHQNRDGG
ncbi:hypothetical protein [Pseudoteredinibacter isoporae]|uniref:PsiF repeat-containing protein n=1 Tax=Pseudoteredinibacter isoporae TaxID=570281 RepID=A0A7X0MXU9_9GAMM|nr:hypothetical protein [Pseudoteredinibacter isoporae]MBB6521342.1 hypothetical protein [Pseudoteredinibacter isoporae]NHO86897.1 hypothetical protein [Pseudoteredinibacter isoporae]NIB24651.1 hypothetical protein [Pseudoteredinibacter isoporae]